MESRRSLKVLIADDESAVRRGLALVLRLEPGLAVVGQARDGAEAVDLADRLEPDVVLMDVKMPRLDGLAATRLIRARHPRIRILVLSVYADRVEDALAAGADRFLLKDSAPDALFAAIRAGRADAPDPRTVGPRPPAADE